MRKRWFFVIFSVLLIAASGCSATSGTAKSGPKTVIVGTGTQFPNICFLDQKGHLTGYDVEVVRAIDKKLPQYNFKFKTMEFSNLLTSLAAKKIDMVAHNMAKNAEREKQFTFNKIPYNYSPMYITVLKNNQSIHSLKDLYGKKVIVGATSNAADYITQYNKEHGNPIKLVYAGQGSNDPAHQLSTGRADATVAAPFAVKFQNETSSIKEKTVGNVLLDTKVYFIFGKGNSELSRAVDKAIKELEKDGTLKKLSKKWLGGDYSKSSF